MKRACPFCAGSACSTLFAYDAPPPGELRFDFSNHGPYRREIIRCNTCGHCVSVHDMDMKRLYEHQYVDATYGKEGLRNAFERIQSLPPAQSDNVGRVQRVLAFAQTYSGPARRLPDVPAILDVGSGLCVFLHRLKAEAGWKCLALDADPRQAAHAREVAGIEAVQGQFGSVEGLGRFDAITFNKVLEHVEDPVSMLAVAHKHLNPGGFIYFELPDAQEAAKDGPGREEFFIDHHHVFSPASMALLIARAGFCIQQMARLREPSGKYTLCAFVAREG